MDVKELRIGNYICGTVADEDTGEERYFDCRVVAVDETGSLGDNGSWAFMVEALNPKESFEYYDEFDPIKLDEKWLLKFGVTKINNSMFRMGALTFQSTNFTEGESLTDRILNSRKAMRICFCGKFLVNLEFVHRFQNLYFALTSKDLINSTNKH